MAPTVTAQSLLDMLQFDFVAFEEEKSKAKAVTASNPAKDAILRGETFPSWYTGETKKLLDILLPKHRAQSWAEGKKESWLVYVNGYKEPQNAELSRLSAAVTTLIDEPQSHAQQIYPLVYFCGLHRKAIQIEEQAVNMMTSLLAQLLNMILDRKVDIDLTGVSGEHITDIKHGMFRDVEKCLGIFGEVVSRLPEDSVVHCAVDNILDFWNYQQPHKNGFTLAFSALDRLVRARGKVHTKLVLTCAPNGGQLGYGYWGLPQSEKHIVDVDRPF